MPKTNVAFVILTWNSEQYIHACLQSIVDCTSFSSFIFVVDNGSVDETTITLKQYENKYPNLICVYLEKNAGTTASRNIILKNLPEECDYVCILDSDTIINDSAITTMIDILQNDPTIGLVGPTMVNLSGVEQLSGRNLPSIGIKLRKAAPIETCREIGSTLELPTTPIIDGLQDVPYLLSACWLMPKSTVDEIGYLDEKIFYAPEDVDYCVRIQQHGLRVVRCWNAEIIHEYQRLSHKKLLSKTNVEHIKGLVYYFQKYGYLFNSSKIFNSESRPQ